MSVPCIIAVNAEDYNLQYIICFEDTTNGDVFVYVSDAPFRVLSNESSSTSITDLFGICTVNCTACLELAYSDSLSEWTTKKVCTIGSLSAVKFIYGSSTSYKRLSPYVTLWGLTNSVPGLHIYTNCSWTANEQSLFGLYSNDLSNLPQGLTEDRIYEIVADQLNRQTASGQQAGQIITETTSMYSSYQAGDIDSSEMQSYVTSNLDTLSDLSATTGNTLSDLMQINNAITYNQAIQDNLLNTASANVRAMIQGYTNTVNTAVSNYQAGTVSQSDTVIIIQQQLDYLQQMITNGTANTTADIAAVNAAINSVTGSLDSVSGFRDLSQSSSDKSQNSDAEELDYLDGLVAETTQTVSSMSPKDDFTDSEISSTGEILSLVWDIDFIKKLLVVAACFMVVSVAIGVRYKL